MYALSSQTILYTVNFFICVQSQKEEAEAYLNEENRQVELQSMIFQSRIHSASREMAGLQGNLVWWSLFYFFCILLYLLGK
jgi:hypothetical protein